MHADRGRNQRGALVHVCEPLRRHVDSLAEGWSLDLFGVMGEVSAVNLPSWSQGTTFLRVRQRPPVV
jgi:hypothetical protein